jgi:hypothetical protein
MHRGVTDVDSDSYDFGDLPNGIEDLEIVAHGGGFTVAASFDLPEKALRDLKAVALAHQFGLVSIDYTRRTYVDPYSHLARSTHQGQAVAIEITSAAKELVRGVISRALQIRDKPDHPGMFASGAAMVRLPITFRLAALTVRQGFHFECAVLCRMILEQLAWVVAVRPLMDKRIFSFEPHRCIGALRRIFPQAGKLYGQLSEAAHIVPERTLRYIEFNREDAQGPSVTLMSFDFAKVDACMMLLLADMYAVVCEVIYYDILPSHAHVERGPDGAWRPLGHRLGAGLLTKYLSISDLNSRAPEATAT